MAREKVIKKNKSAWRLLLIGFLFGVLASFLALVFIAFKWGPQGESSKVDLYSGHIISHKSFLWKHSRISLPMEPHSLWAIKHQHPVRSWYVFGSSIGRGEWFGGMIAGDSSTRSYVYEIYSLQIPEKEKVNLLHQYHKDLDTLKQVDKDYIESLSMKSFHTNWKQKLEEIGTTNK